jgi:DNA-binding winged helix-turn-helix (wHTH) protein
MPSPLPSLVRFANFEVDLRAGELRRDGSKVRLQEQPFQLLTALLEWAGEVVTREELRNRLWSADTFVDFDHRLAVAVSKLRDALRDSAEKPKFVETVGRRGYRFLGQLETADSRAADSQPGTGEPLMVWSERPKPAELPKVALPGRTPTRTGRAIFLLSAGFVILVSMLAVARFVRLRSGKEQVLTPRSLAILPRLPRIISSGCTHHEIGLCKLP